jgi:secreted trypsin-like serine protease
MYTRLAANTPLFIVKTAFSVGDSGGPLISNGGDAETDVLVGITSW